MLKLSEKQKSEFLDLFPDEAPELIETGDYDEISDFLDIESAHLVNANHGTTPRSKRIENLLDDINWTYSHGENE